MCRKLAPVFKLDLWVKVRLNEGHMKTIFCIVIGTVMGSVLLSSCGECSCKGNSDYLRDVPVTHSQRFN